jgi:flagellar hook-associated protein 2
MASISSVGIGSGLDANSIITKLVDLEKQPLTSLKAKASLLGAQLSAYGSIKSQVSSLADVALGLGTAALWNPLTISSSNTAAVTASAVGIPSKSSYSVEVTQLARGQSVASSVQTASAAMGTGTLTLQLGTWSAGLGTFTAGSASAVTIAVGTGEDTLTAIATKINDAAAGVVATVITDSAGERLSLRSSSTGVASGFRIQVSGDSDGVNNDSAGLSRLAFDPQSGAFGMAATGVTTLQARDANATLNGVAVTSASNTFTGLVPGLSFTVGQITSAPVDVSVGQDLATIKKTITDFVAAYNTLNATLTEDTRYDPSKRQASILQGDSTTVGLQNALRALVGSRSSGGVYSRLSDIGIAMQRDGSLLVGTGLDTALKDLDSVKTFFTKNNNDAASNGLGLKLKSFTQGLLVATGTVSAKEAAIQKSVGRNTEEQTKVTTRAAAVEARLRQTYSALDAKMGSLTAIGNYVSQQVTLWNKNTS